MTRYVALQEVTTDQETIIFLWSREKLQQVGDRGQSYDKTFNETAPSIGNYESKEIWKSTFLPQ